MSRCLRAILLAALAALAASAKHEDKGKGGVQGCQANKDQADCNAASECIWVRDSKCIKPAGCMVNTDQSACETATDCKWEGDKCFKAVPPAVGDKPKEEERPKDCAAMVCSNGGVCYVNPLGSPPTRCNCTGTGFCGPKCGKQLSECQRQRDEKNEMGQAADMAGRAGRDLERAKAKCTDEAKKMLCPAGVGPNSRTCVEAISDCFITGGSFNATLMERYKKAKDAKCPGEGQKYCGQEDVCIGRGASCAPQTKCPDSKAYRCADWKCAADESKCDEGARPVACPDGQMRCPDGLCYEASGGGGLKECAKQGVQWEGCPPGKMECTNGKPGMCADSVDACNAKVGCVAPLVACGFERDATSGRPLFGDDGKPQVKCVAPDSCPGGKARPPQREKKLFDPSQGGKVEVKTEDGSRPAMALKIGRGGFKTASGGAINFTIDSVPDSLVQEGAFGAYFDSGALLSSLIKIDPGAAVEVEGMMELDIPLLDASTEDPAICEKVLAQSQMISTGDITNITDGIDPAVPCSKGELGACSCAINITHFSTYGVVDKVVAYEESQIITSASSTPATPPGGAQANDTDDSLSNAALTSSSPVFHCLLFSSITVLLTSRMVQL